MVVYTEACKKQKQKTNHQVSYCHENILEIIQISYFAPKKTDSSLNKKMKINSLTLRSLKYTLFLPECGESRHLRKGQLLECQHFPIGRRKPTFPS